MARDRELTCKKPQPKAQPACSQNKGLSNTREELAGLQIGPFLARGRGQRGSGQSQKWANSAPQMASPTKLQTGSLANQEFWDFGRLTSARRVAARDQLPRRDTRCTRLACPETGWDCGGERFRCTWGEGARQAPGSLSFSDGDGTKHRPNRVCAFVEYPRT